MSDYRRQAAESATSAHRRRGRTAPSGSSHARRARAGSQARDLGVELRRVRASAAIIVFFALAAVSEIVLPMTFAAVLAIVFKPLVGALQRRRLKPTLAAGSIVLGLLALMAGVVVATVRGVTEQADQISDVGRQGAATRPPIRLDALGIDQAVAGRRRGRRSRARPDDHDRLPHRAGLRRRHRWSAMASGIILGALIMYYLLKDGTRLRRAVVATGRPRRSASDVDDFIGDSCRILRDYGKGRTVMSAIVAVVIGVVALLLGLPLVFTIIVVNFVGGYIPYIGAFLGGGLAVIIALGDGGLPEAADHARRGARRQPDPGELRGAQGHGPHPRHPPARRTHRHRAGRPPRRHRRPHPGRARMT